MVKLAVVCILNHSNASPGTVMMGAQTESCQKLFSDWERSILSSLLNRESHVPEYWEESLDAEGNTGNNPLDSIISINASIYYFDHFM